MFRNSSYPSSRFVSYQGFTFLASDVEAALIAKLSEHDHLANNDEGALLRWVRQRDEADQKPSPVPDEWKRFIFIAGDLAHDGKGEVCCDQCGTSMPSTDLASDDKNPFMQRLLCPKGHVVFEVVVMYV